MSLIQRRDDLVAPTKNDYKRSIRQFCQWLYQDEDFSLVNWIDVRQNIGNSILPK
ncbi:hypothetical protein [Methanococcoides burtonii]|uniref:hypothetical protein n=1 Tax=Methanococcoides burtonii TaxID=29291 RepID=UPI0012F62BCF|nr:hypothetical protein [Methanococcoides burtonii]